MQSAKASRLERRRNIKSLLDLAPGSTINATTWGEIHQVRQSEGDQKRNNLSICLDQATTNTLKRNLEDLPSEGRKSRKFLKGQVLDSMLCETLSGAMLLQ